MLLRRGDVLGDAKVMSRDLIEGLFCAFENSETL